MTHKVVYFLGAGASYGAGATASVQAGGKIPIPTQATFWATFLRFCRNKKNQKDIESFLFRYFLGYGKVPSRLSTQRRREMLVAVDVEEVFTFLSERVRAPSTSPQLRTYALRIWTALVSEVGSVFRRFKPNSQTRSVYRKFVKSHCRATDAVVSFNYDTVFEESLAAVGRPIYYGVSAGKGLQLLKPHGSVNWSIGGGGAIKVVDSPEQSVIVAPTHLKFVMAGYSDQDHAGGYLDQSEQISVIWEEMEKRMREAVSLVFIGYSFPVADLYFSSVLRTVFADSGSVPNVVIVNPDAVAIADRVKKRFSLNKIDKYFDLNQFLQSRRQELLVE